MKKIACIPILFFCFVFSAHSQWITLYEGGSGTTNKLNDDWGKRYYFEGTPGSNNNQCISGSWNDSYKLRMLYYQSGFGAGTAGMYKQINGMENYASIRVYLEMNLPDSVGTVHYAALTDELFADSLNHPLIDEFASDQLGVTIPYSNIHGHNSLYLFADLLRGDSVLLWFNYIRIEADTTQMLNLVPVTTDNFTIYASSDAVYIHPGNENTSFDLQVYNTLGVNVFDGNYTGNQILPMEVEAGTYTVQIRGQNGQFTRKRIYLE